MKKYRLKKWYPSLNIRIEKGDIATWDGQHYRIVKEYQQYEDCGLTEVWYHFVKEEVENNPDFWELIVEKEPLFIAKDGAVFFDDFYYLVTKPYFVKTKLKAKENVYKGDGFIYFKHESNADEYIWRNKPVFSYEDFIKWGNIPYPRAIEQLAIERSEQ